MIYLLEMIAIVSDATAECESPIIFNKSPEIQVVTIMVRFLANAITCVAINCGGTDNDNK